MVHREDVKNYMVRINSVREGGPGVYLRCTLQCEVPFIEYGFLLRLVSIYEG